MVRYAVEPQISRTVREVLLHIHHASHLCAAHSALKRSTHGPRSRLAGCLVGLSDHSQRLCSRANTPTLTRRPTHSPFHTNRAL